jgi:hypothetical protein
MLIWNVVRRQTTTKLNKVQRMLLVASCKTARSTTFTVLFAKHTLAQTQWLHFINDTGIFNKCVEIPFGGSMWVRTLLWCCCGTGKEWDKLHCLKKNQPSPAWATNWNDPSAEHYRITNLSPPGYESFPFPSTLQLLNHQLFIIHRIRFQERLSSNILHIESKETLTWTIHILQTQITSACIQYIQVRAHWVPKMMTSSLEMDTI